MDGHSLSRDEAVGRVETIEPAVGHLIRQLIQNDVGKIQRAMSAKSSWIWKWTVSATWPSGSQRGRP